MKLFTSQSKYTLDVLDKHGIYTPTLPIYKDNILDIQSMAQEYIIDLYNKKFNTDYNGLVFCAGSYHMTGKFNNIDDYIKGINEFGASGTCPLHDGCRVLELNVPDNINTMPIDFYIYSTLISLFDDGTDDEIDYGKRYLFISNITGNLPSDDDYDKISKNTIDNIYEFPQFHIPYISSSWIIDSHKIVKDDLYGLKIKLCK